MLPHFLVYLISNHLVGLLLLLLLRILRIG
jgi:hypothetical protein